MPPEQIVEMIKNHQVDPTWIIFRYQKLRSFLIFFYKLFFTALFLGSAMIIAKESPKPLTQDNTIVIYSMGIVGIISLIIFLKHLYTLFFLNSNMIVFTSDGVIKSLRGKQQFWNYSHMSNLQQIVTQSKNTMPTYSIEFKDTQSGKILELVHGGEFGPSQNIFTLLRSKVSN